MSKASLTLRWQALCEAAIQEARDAGASDPQIYIEAESGFVVVDGETHDAEFGFPCNTGTSRQDRVVLRLGWPRGIKANCGAW